MTHYGRRAVEPRGTIADRTVASSAGGGLRTGLALLVRDRGEIPVQFQLLDCPMIDPTQTTPSSRLDDLLVWSKVSNEFGWRSYLGDLYSVARRPSAKGRSRWRDMGSEPSSTFSPR